MDSAAGDLSGTVASDAASDAESEASDGAAEASGGDGGRGDSGGGDEPEAGKNEEETSCPVQHSFVGATPVLMADGSSKPIDEIKAGDKIRDSVPGQAGTQVHTVQRVIVTHTDHDFVALGITKDKTPPKASAETSRSGTLGRQVLRKAAMGLAASAAIITTALGLSHHSQPQLAADTVHSAPTAVSAPTGQRLTTTFHHAFYDETQASFVEADHLHTGDVLQTPTGTAHVTTIHLFHANTTTYDLTIGGLHTYYVVAGATPVLVHNCNTVYRSDTRDPSDIFQSGFEPRGGNMDLMEHASGYSTDSGYVSTTKYEGIATGRGGNVYHIDGVDGADVNHEWPDNPFSSEEEIAVPGRVDTSRIIGARMRDGTWMDNPNYVPLGK